MLARPLAVAAALLLASAAPAADPAATDRIAVQVLKDVHNRGAEMYPKDPVGCARLYEGALRTVRAFLDHHPKIQEDIDKGLDEDPGGDRARAFRLHEVIEKVRADLRAADPKPAPKPEPAPAPKPAAPAPAPLPPAGVGGTLTLDGKPLAGAGVMLVSLDLPRPRVFRAWADAAGKFAVAAPVPDSTYVVVVTAPPGASVPEKYAAPSTSGLVVAVKGGAAGASLGLAGK